MTVGGSTTRGLHQGQPVLTAGKALDQAKAAMILVHGRGATAQGILALATELNHSGLAYLAPQAVGRSWYPYSFLAPIAQNEPALSSALVAIARVLAQANDAGVSPKRTILLGFSQGACLTLEFAARNARRYGGIVGLSGGLIGPDGTPRGYSGSLAGTPVFLGCSDTDPHIPKDRVLYSADVLQELGGEVTTRLYPNMGHTINHDELDFIKNLLAQAAE